MAKNTLKEKQTKITIRQAFLNFLDALTDNRTFCLLWLIAGFIYFTVYGFIDNPDLVKTASVIGKTHPRLFIWWAVFTGISLFLNIHYLYKKYSFYEGKLAKAGNILTYLHVICIFTCVNIPSVEPEDGKTLQMVAHWSTALLFAIFFSFALLLFLLDKATKKSVKHTVAFVIYAATLIVMVALLIAFGKSGGLESIPLWVAYVILFLLNYTNLFDTKKIK